MIYSINETHNPNISSWVNSANQPNNDFPIQNLPFAIFRSAESTDAFRGGIAIGTQVVDLAAVSKAGIFDDIAQKAIEACAQPTLNRYMEMGPAVWSALRLALFESLRTGSDKEAMLTSCLVPQANVEYALPCTIGDYTDFYTSIYHATTVGSLFRPDNPLLPNYKWVPIGYHGRASSIDISGQTFRRPTGQTKTADAYEPSFGPCKHLDHELEMGIFIGPGNTLGEPISIEKAENHVFGLCVLNDWSARDIQAWEYQPLGPFLAKNFASTISPWVVTLEALAPYRAPFQRPADDPQPLPYLTSTQNSAEGNIDIQLQVLLQTESMRENNQAAEPIAHSNFIHSYWTIAQMVAHHTVNGCNLRSGDLLGSGTQSGPSQQEAGSMLELSNGGKQAIILSNGEARVFIEDGDTVILQGFCKKPDAARIGFGTVRSTVLPAKTDHQ